MHIKCDLRTSGPNTRVVAARQRCLSGVPARTQNEDRNDDEEDDNVGIKVKSYLVPKFDGSNGFAELAPCTPSVSSKMSGSETGAPVARQRFQFQEGKCMCKAAVLEASNVG